MCYRIIKVRVNHFMENIVKNTLSADLICRCDPFEYFAVPPLDKIAVYLRALFATASAVCVLGLYGKGSGSYWSMNLDKASSCLALIQIDGLG